MQPPRIRNTVNIVIATKNQRLGNPADAEFAPANATNYVLWTYTDTLSVIKQQAETNTGSMNIYLISSSLEGDKLKSINSKTWTAIDTDYKIFTNIKDLLPNKNKFPVFG